MNNIDENVSGTSYVAEAVGIMDPHGLLKLLDQRAELRFTGLLLVIAFHGYGEVRVVSTRRTILDQAVLYGRGRDRAECVKAGVQAKYADMSRSTVTWTRPVDSYHVRGLAMDIDTSEYKSSDLGPFQNMAVAFGMVWGGWWKKRDYGHFQLNEDS